MSTSLPDRQYVGEDWYVQPPTGGLQLRVSDCNHCGKRWFPPRFACSSCASHDLTQNRTGNTGIAYASSHVHVGSGAWPKSYVLSYIDIDRVRVLMHTDSDRSLDPDTPVRLVLGRIGTADDVELWSYRAQPDLITQESQR
ncbi:hypothetical protein [Nocardia sp. NPDC052112]|uniref:Zn-ribbon domain-containing OB-fold protein n=1 Tax=Nocardia sp. NPDC052112 TaxID=3155646 RepID=UPI00343B332A